MVRRDGASNGFYTRKLFKLSLPIFLAIFLYTQTVALRIKVLQIQLSSVQLNIAITQEYCQYEKSDA